MRETEPPVMKVSCWYRGASVECPLTEWGIICQKCGWNPEVEEKRKERMKI